MTDKQQRAYVAKTGISSCPFCGGIAEARKVLRNGYEAHQSDPDAYAHYVACLSCAAQGPWCKSGVVGAILQWNRRTKKTIHGNLNQEQIDRIESSACERGRTG